jgi:two-component system cell cycle response regulator
MRVLIADDDRGTTTILERTLQRWRLPVEVAHDGHAAWEMLCRASAPVLAIIDWMMPGIDGPQLCERIRRHPSLATSHVILLTARDARTDVITGLNAGADDYMVKPFDLDELRARVHVGIRVVGLQERLAVQMEQRRAARDSLGRLANTDALTDLASRRSWFERAAAEFARLQRYGRPLSVLTADLDMFKQVNDTYGHQAGDEVLRVFAASLRAQCRMTDVVGRLGGEEFAVLLPETPVETAGDVARRVLAGCRALTVAAPSGELITVTCSIGVAEARKVDAAIDAALGRADHALYEAKRRGRDRFEIAGTADAPQEAPACVPS